jgi:hypothetical protein
VSLFGGPKNQENQEPKTKTKARTVPESQKKTARKGGIGQCYPAHLQVRARGLQQRIFS